MMRANLTSEEMASQAIRIVHTIIRKEEARQARLVGSTAAKASRDRVASYSRSNSLQRAQQSLMKYLRSIK